MPSHAYIKDGQITEVELPKVYIFSDGSQTGNFDIMGESVHRQEGFFPLEEDRPTPNHGIERVVFDHYEEQATKVVARYRIAAVSIEELKANKCLDIEDKEQELLRRSFFDWSDHTFVLNEEAVNNVVQQKTLNQLKPMNPMFSWTDADGEEVPMNQLQFEDFAKTIGGAKERIIGAKKYHTQQVKALTEPQAVYDYDFSQGW